FILSSVFGSKLQRSLPVAPSSAISRSLGVVAYNTPSTMIGLHCISDPLNSSPVLNVQATVSFCTFSRLICRSVEYRMFSALPPYTDQVRYRSWAHRNGVRSKIRSIVRFITTVEYPKRVSLASIWMPLLTLPLAAQVNVTTYQYDNT